MKEVKDFSFRYSEYTSIDELSIDEQNVVKCAIEAQHSSYSPYSRFRVGAAVLLMNGKVVVGSNQENGAYPSGMCAERVALFAAGANYPGVNIKLMAISASNMKGLVEYPITPCGGCRQVMLEYSHVGGVDYPVIMVGSQKIIRVDGVADLLPFNFFSADDAK